jgi:uncharacterized protein (TIGR03086 family)
MSSTTEKYLRVSAGFTARIAGCAPELWSSPSPCSGWTAADVAEHVIEVHRGQLEAIGADIEAASTESTLERWTKTTDRFLAAMNDPELAGKPVNGPLGTVAFKQLAGSIVLHDLLVHTWDLAVATQQSTELDTDAVTAALEKMQPMSAFIRGPGMFGPEVTPPEHADAQTQFLCFVGRSPRSPLPRS